MNEAAGGDLRPDGAAVAATNPESAALEPPANNGDAPAVAVSAAGPAASGKPGDDSQPSRKTANGTGGRRTRAASSRGGSRSGGKTVDADDGGKTDTAGRRTGGRAGASTKSSTGRKSRSRKSTDRAADRAATDKATTDRSVAQAANATREAVDTVTETGHPRIVRQDDPPPAPVTEPSFPLDMKVGDYLCSIREKNRLSTRQIADTLRIQERYVEAIEGSRYRELPGVAYASGFVRGYADLFGADSDEVAIRYKEEAADYAARASVAMAPSADDTWFPKGRLVALSVILAAGAYIGWLVYNDSQSRHSQVASVPPHLAQLAGDTAPDVVADTGTAGPATSPAAGQPISPTTGQSGPIGDGAADQTGTPEQIVGQQIVGQQIVGTAGDTLGDTLPGSDWEAIPRPVPADSGIATAPSAESASTDATGRGPALEAGIIPPATVPTIPVPNNSEAGLSEAGLSEVVGPAAGATQVAATDTGNAAGDPPSIPSIAASPTIPTVPEPRASVTVPEPAPGGAISWPRTDGDPVPASPTSAAASEPPAVDDGRIMLVATGESWVRVRDSRGNTVFAGVMKPGDQYSVPDATGMTMLTGNAGHVYFMVDGLRVEPVGPLGSVRRGVQLDPTLLLSGDAYPGGTR